MTATWLRVRVLVSGQWPRLLMAAVVVGITGGLAMGLVMGTRRTDSAPDRYTERSGGDPDLVLTQFSGEPIDRLVGELPGVVSTQALVFVTAFLLSPIDGTLVDEPNPFAGNDNIAGTRLIEGRFVDPANANEFTVNGPMAELLTEQFDTHVGDEFQVAAYDQAQVDGQFDTTDQPAVAPFTATLVGITESPTEFDDPSPMMVFSSAFLDEHADVGVVQTLMATYLDDGVDARAVMDQIRQLPDGANSYPVSFRLVSDSARRAVRFQVTALWLVSTLSVVAAAVVVAQVVGRTLRIGDDERRSMSALGWRHRDLAVERAIEGGSVAVVAAPVAIAVAYALTAIFPIGVLAAFEPDPGRRMDRLVAALGALALIAVIVATAAATGYRRTRARAVTDHVGGLSEALAASGARMPLSVGARYASSSWRGRRPWGSLTAGVVAVAGLVGSAIVGLSLTDIVDQPARWGVNYDQLFGNPYIDVESDIVQPILDIPDVAAATGANLGSLTIDGADIATIGFDSAKGDLVPTVLSGRIPVITTDVGLGAEVARRLGVRIGDTVEAVGASGQPRSLNVVGVVVTPDSAGNGAAVTFETYRILNPQATANVVLVSFRPGAPPSVVDAIATANYSPPGALITPTSVRALARVTAAPFLLGIVLAILLVVACAYLLTSSLRARRRDLATLRALGADGRQLRSVVHCQASLAAAMITIVGLPLGIVVGRWIVSLLTDALGIVPGASVSTVVIVGLGVTGLLIANALALWPAHHAAAVRLDRSSADL